jgi:DNA-binding NtrC family response regulator
VARLIHAQSARRSRPLVAVNCGGIPETLLESELFGHVRGSFTGAYRDKIGLLRQADRGTLFLDEVGEMSLGMQASLLRFTETGEIQSVGADGPSGCIDVRLLAATNRDLRAQVSAGLFREDLYYRLNVICIQVPPLRDRRDDIVFLLRHYLQRASAAEGLPCPELTPPAEALMVDYAWPGNIRELKNVVERLVAASHSRKLTPDDLPVELRGSAPAVAAPAHAAAGPAPAPEPPAAAAAVSEKVLELWGRLMAGEDFWQTVHSAFKAHDLTRADLASLIDLGLRHTHGSYRALLGVFGLPPTDYGRFHAFLYQQRCNLPVGPYRRQPARARVPGVRARREAG